MGTGYIYFALIEILCVDGKASVLALVVFLIFLTLDGMFFSPLGSSFISKYASSRHLSVMMSVWGIATFFAAKGYGVVYKFAFGRKFAFHHACFEVAIIAFASTVILFLMDKKLSRLVEKDE